MNRELQNYIAEKLHEMMGVDCCCREAKEAANAWFASIGTENEIQMLRALISELEEDIMPIDGLIAFAKSERCAQIFGDRQQDEIVHAYKLKADGIKFCDCPACTAVQAILKKKPEILSGTGV